MTEEKKKKYYLPILLLLAALILAVAARYLWNTWEEKKVNTETLFYDALADTASWNSYRYTLDASILLNNYKTAKTKLSGEIDNSGNLHVWGKLMDTEFEASQFGNDHYHFNSPEKKWIILENSPLTQNGILPALLKPGLNFNFTDIISVSYEGKTKKQGQHLYHFRVIPKEGFHVADTYFTDFVYEVDVDSKTKRLSDAAIYAAARSDGKQRLELRIHFFDVNEDFTLTPPKNDD